jgi:hypothetical protein
VLFEFVLAGVAVGVWVDDRMPGIKDLFLESTATEIESHQD